MKALSESRELHTWKSLIGRRAFLLAPVVLVTALALADSARWRGPLMVCTLAAIGGVVLYESRRQRRVAGPVQGSLLVPMIGQMAILLVTGGLDSPVLEITAILPCIAGAQGRGPLIVLAQCGLLWAMAVLQVRGWPPRLLPEILGGGAHAHAPALVLTTVAAHTVIALLAYWIIGGALRRGYDGAFAESVRARDEVVRLGATHAAELQAVCGEISHDLKNPLATVRGLAELMALDAPGPRNAERLAVLLRETVRMQASLDELLNLARPLSPLEVASVDLAALGEEVCSLHEGLCAAAGVALVARAPASDGVVRGDRRKLRQVLVNLVQNAVEASARGATVTVTVRAEGDDAAVEVQDEGAGLDAAVGERAFEPGVTSKAAGNGIGLTIARAIARQHGGDVVLRSGATRGCVASLLLPGRRVAPEAVGA